MPETKVTPDSIQVFKPGTRLVSENDFSRKMFIIKAGKARVFKTYMGQRITLAILGEGEVFGELSFFDAEPRSASVEALTELSAVVVDGERATEQISSLPGWVYPIFRSVFHRFREADRKLAVLQSMNEYQKKNFKTDNVAQTIYLELMRFIKTLRLVASRDAATGADLDSAKLYQDLDELLGNRYLGLRVFWRLLKEYDFINNEKEEKEKKVELNVQAIDALSQYLGAEVESANFLLLSHTAIAVLSRIVGSLQLQAGSGIKQLYANPKELGLNSIPLYDEALKELQDKKILTLKADDSLSLDPEKICNLFMYQSILKSFDHTMVSTE